MTDGRSLHPCRHSDTNGEFVTPDFWLDGVLVDHRTGYLLVAEGLVYGSPENGFHWTANGAEWVANVLDGAVDDRVKEKQ